MGSAGFKWHSIGGRTNSTPALTSPSDGVMVAFLRGTGNVAWCREFLGQTAGVTTGWHSLGGVLTSGVTALTEPVSGYSSVFALGPTTGPWADAGTWPALGGWKPVLIEG